MSRYATNVQGIVTNGKAHHIYQGLAQEEAHSGTLAQDVK